MKRILPLFTLLFAVLAPLLLGAATPTQAQDDTLDINAIAAGVVALAVFDDDVALASGSGIIVQPTGLIYTNRHVIEDSDTIHVYMIDDVGERAVHRYVAEVVFVSGVIDFATLQITHDADGNVLDPESLNLPYVPIQEQTAIIGNDVLLFGYPGIAESYLVATPGQVVGIQNDTINDTRAPLWYLSNAETGPGGSGGLAINTSGEFIGIPTSVRHEDVTAGRILSILSSTAIAAVLENGDTALDGPTGSFILTLTNESDVTFCFVNISPSTEDFWGEDWLDGEEIAPGDSYEFSVDAGYQDVQALDCDGEIVNYVMEVYVNDNVEVVIDSSEEGEQAGDSEDDRDDEGTGEVLELTVENDSDIEICEVYVSPTTADNWGPERLEGDVLAEGDSITLDVTSDEYDVLLVDCDGNRVADQRGIDVTEAPYTLTYEG